MYFIFLWWTNPYILIIVGFFYYYLWSQHNVTYHSSRPCVFIFYSSRPCVFIFYSSRPCVFTVYIIAIGHTLYSISLMPTCGWQVRKLCALCPTWELPSHMSFRNWEQWSLPLIMRTVQERWAEAKRSKDFQHMKRCYFVSVSLFISQNKLIDEDFECCCGFQ